MGATREAFCGAVDCTYSLWPRKPTPPLFSILKRLFSPSDPFEKSLKTTCLSSDHYQYCLIREEISAYTAYRGVGFRGHRLYIDCTESCGLLRTPGPIRVL